MDLYNIDWEKLVRRDIPIAWRTNFVVKWLLALISPLFRIHFSFRVLRSQKLEELKVTGQVCKLRYFANLRFDPIDQRIEILDAENGETVFVFLEVENRPLYLPTFLAGTASDFTVQVPFELQVNDHLLRSFFNTYRLPSKRFNIVYV